MRAIRAYRRLVDAPAGSNQRETTRRERASAASSASAARTRRPASRAARRARIRNQSAKVACRRTSNPNRTGRPSCEALIRRQTDAMRSSTIGAMMESPCAYGKFFGRSAINSPSVKTACGDHNEAGRPHKAAERDAVEKNLEHDRGDRQVENRPASEKTPASAQNRP